MDRTEFEKKVFKLIEEYSGTIIFETGLMPKELTSKLNSDSVPSIHIDGILIDNKSED